MTWLNGHSLAQTLFTCLYLHDVGTLLNPTLSVYCKLLLLSANLLRNLVERSSVAQVQAVVLHRKRRCACYFSLCCFIFFVLLCFVCLLGRGRKEKQKSVPSGFFAPSFRIAYCLFISSLSATSVSWLEAG